VAAVGKRPTEIRIYYEGDKALTPGFAQFFSQLRDKATASRCKVNLISGRSGSEACRDFATALKTHKNAWNILLKDSEGPDHGNLCEEQAWDKSHSDSIFWMVQMMESWFHADNEALETFYGPGFKPKF